MSKATATLPHPASRSVPIIEYEAAAGIGRVDLDEVKKGEVRFQRGWLEEHAIDPTRCVVIRVAGESMEPTLPGGCSILINRARVKRKTGYIYAIRTYDGLIVKRLKRADNEWQLLSDNPAWPEIDWPDDAKIIGQVISTARSLI